MTVSPLLTVFTQSFGIVGIFEFALVPLRHLRIFFGTVDQLRLFGTMFRSGPPKSLT